MLLLSSTSCTCVAFLLQNLQKPLPVVTLNDDFTLLGCSSHATFLLQEFAQSIQVSLAAYERTP